jgi:hypothetical protein
MTIATAGDILRMGGGGHRLLVASPNTTGSNELCIASHELFIATHDHCSGASLLGMPNPDHLSGQCFLSSAAVETDFLAAIEPPA